MSLHEKVSDHVLQKIQSGEWKKGAMIPKEMDLCEQLGVSRSTVRTAMARLVSDGYLSRVKGKGTYVTSPRVIESSTIFIESFAQELAGRGLTAKTELLKFHMTPAKADVAEKLRVPEGESVLKIQRLRYAEKSFEEGPIVLSTSYFPRVYVEFIERYDLEKMSMHEVLHENGLKRELFEKEISVKVLSDKACRLLGEKKGALAVSVTSIAWDQNGHELEYSVSDYPVTRNRFILRVHS
ncbi:GntR family transcriptional regulator [Eubacteriales bacterium OttesenSCG-928-A19]|nr:GntR family transcriptional regulator [Eubacteriales bacterium OttesenSCG-928-A19]